jgi:pimeloyl-ACP methyl ester carboxylesterase
MMCNLLTAVMDKPSFARMPKRIVLRTLGAVSAGLLASAALPAMDAFADTGSAPGASPAADTASAHYTGTLQDGGQWIADVPSGSAWNGTLLLFSHGFGPTTAQDSPSDAVARALLERGYALAGSSYDPTGSWWALNSAERDQFGTLDAFGDTVGSATGRRPTRVITIGESMGGLVNAQLARDGGGRIDGSLGLCGLVAGGVDLDDYQLDGEYAIARLLDPNGGEKLVDFSSAAEEQVTADRLTALVTAAQQTPAGRARIALAAAYLNTADWAPGSKPPASDDYPGQEAQQYDWLVTQGVLAFVEYGRYQVEQSAGGNTSWNTGVDYRRLLDSSEHRSEVRGLYRASGLDLGADLSALNSGPRVVADPVAVSRLKRSSTAGQSLAVPLLDLHTTADQLVPVEQENVFGQRVRAAGDGALLRQAYVHRQSHCNFTTAETVAGLEAVNSRISSGRWGASATTAALQSSAEAMGSGAGGAAFIDFRPSRLVGVR